MTPSFSVDSFAHADFRAMLRVATAGLIEMDEIVALALLSYFAAARKANGELEQVNHVLLEGLNGLAKSRLVGKVNNAIIGPALQAFYGLVKRDALVRTMGSPDQTPADILGMDLLDADENGRRLRFQDGPLLQCRFVFYADELNRSPPRTQSALLEAMAEQQVTINSLDQKYAGHRTRRLPHFFLIASQNPSHHEGTYPLPEALLDRFMIMVTMPYTSRLEEVLADSVTDRSAGTAGDGDLEVNAVWEKFKVKLVTRREDLRRHEGPFRRLLSEFAKHLKQLEPEWSRAQAQLNAEGAIKGWRDALERVLLGIANNEPAQWGVVEDVLVEQRREWLYRLKEEVSQVSFPAAVQEYASNLVYSTWNPAAVTGQTSGLERRLDRRKKVLEAVGSVRQGSSPRGGLALRDLARALAWASGRNAATIEDVEAIAEPVLRHRVVLTMQAHAHRISSDQVIRRILEVNREWAGKPMQS